MGILRRNRADRNPGTKVLDDAVRKKHRELRRAERAERREKRREKLRGALMFVTSLAGNLGGVMFGTKKIGLVVAAIIASIGLAIVVKIWGM